MTVYYNPSLTKVVIPDLASRAPNGNLVPFIFEPGRQYDLVKLGFSDVKLKSLKSFQFAVSAGLIVKLDDTTP